MLQLNDINFLRWIAQRLVNRYKEDPKIILIIEDILNKITCEQEFISEFNTILTNCLETSIQNLQNINDYYRQHNTIVSEKIKEKCIQKNTKTFENIDLSRVLK